MTRGKELGGCEWMGRGDTHRRPCWFFYFRGLTTAAGDFAADIGCRLARVSLTQQVFSSRG